MKDELHKRIHDGLDGELDGKLFEDFAIDALQKVYPDLTPLKGGHDDGRDGLIFLTKNGHEVLLVCTTEKDIKANLRGSLQQYKAKGHKGKWVIFATSRKVTPEERNKLNDLAKEEGFKLKQVHGRDDFALRLYSNHVWLKKLLNLESNQQALSINPATHRPQLSLTVRGRGGLFQWLNETTGDCIILGQPGCGKTFAVRDYIMDRGGLFVVSNNPDEIIAEVREKKPDILVIDDAHGKLDLVRSLKQIRTDSGAGFRILLTSWGLYRDQLKNELTVADGNIYELDLLGRDTILQIIEDCGVWGTEELQAQIVRQAEGKPGLAATLCYLVTSGEARDVYIGDSLGEHLIGYFQKELGSKADDALSVLAVVALGGEAGITLKNTAEILGESQQKTLTTVSGLAVGGVISYVGEDALSVRPPHFRYYLAKDRYFNDKASIDPSGDLYRYENLGDAVEVMIQAGLRGGTVNKKSLLVLIEKTSRPSLFAGYAAFGEQEANEIIESHPDMALKSPHEFLLVAPHAIIPLMLDQAVGDTRELHNAPNHPLRVLGDWVKDVLPGEDDVAARKKALVDCLIEWRKEGKDATTFAHALSLALVPIFETHRNDPGSGMQLRYATGHLAAQDLDSATAKWKDALLQLDKLPGEAWKYIVELLTKWAYERTGLNMPTDEQVEALNKGATTMLDDIAEASKPYPGIQASLKPIAAHLGKTISVARDEEYDTLFPVEDDRTAAGRLKNETEEMEAVKKLAAKYAKLTATDVVKKVVDLTKQADAASQSWPRYNTTIAGEIAAQVSNLSEWVSVTLKEADDPYFLYPFLQELHNKDPEAAKPLLLKALQHGKHKFAAAEVVLRRPFANDELWKALLPNINDFSLVIRSIVIRDQMDTETLLHILGGKFGAATLSVAETLAISYKHAIPENLLPEWEQALLDTRLTGDYTADEQIAEALELHPPTIIKWFRARLKDKPSRKLGFDGYYHVAHKLVKALSRDERLALINELPYSLRAEQIVRQLVGGDIDLFKALLANPNAKRYQLAPLSLVSGETWINFAIEALNAGCDESGILRASFKLEGSWSGPASDHYKGLMELAEVGTKSNDPRVASAAKKLVEYYQQLYDEAIEHEKHQDIYGFSG